MSLETQYADLKSAFEKYIGRAESAIDSLKTFADRGSPGGTYSSKWEIYGDLPIALITGADQMVQEVEALANDIKNVNYVPPPPMPNFVMLDHKVWKDPFCEQIEASLSDYIISMGIPNKTYQDAIFNEDYDRKLQTLNDLLELADAKVGARGFTYPNSQSAILKLDAQQKYQFDLTQIGRDITKLVTEWARQNYQFAIDKGITLEQFHADFTYKYCTGFVDIYKNMILASVEQFKAELSKYIEPIRALTEAAKLPIELGKVNADIEKANAEVFTESNKAKISEAVQTYQANLQAAVTTFGTKVQALAEVAKESAEFVKSASRSSITIQK